MRYIFNVDQPILYAPIAQLVEQMTLNHFVEGSNPSGRTIFLFIIQRLTTFTIFALERSDVFSFYMLTTSKSR